MPDKDGNNSDTSLVSHKRRRTTRDSQTDEEPSKSDESKATVTEDVNNSTQPANLEKERAIFEGCSCARKLPVAFF